MPRQSRFSCARHSALEVPVKGLLTMGRVQARAVASTNRKKLPRRTGARDSAGSFSPRQPGLACWPARRRSARRPLRQQPRAPAPCPRHPTPSRIPARATTRYAGPPAIRTRTWHARLARADNHPGQHGDSVRFILPAVGGQPVIRCCRPWSWRGPGWAPARPSSRSPGGPAPGSPRSPAWPRSSSRCCKHGSY